MPNFKKDKSKFTMKGFSPFNMGSPYKATEDKDKPVPKTKPKSNQMKEANADERAIMKKQDSVHNKMKNMDKNSKEYKDLMDKSRNLDNQLYPYD